MQEEELLDKIKKALDTGFPTKVVPVFLVIIIIALSLSFSNQGIEGMAVKKVFCEDENFHGTCDECSCIEGKTCVEEQGKTSCVIPG